MLSEGLCECNEQRRERSSRDGVRREEVEKKKESATNNEENEVLEKELVEKEMRRRKRVQRTSKRRKKKTHKLYALVIVLLAIMIIMLSVFLLFFIQGIEVEGNDYCSDKMIIDTVKNDRYSVNALYVYGKYALGHGEVLPCLDKMEVSMKRPWVLQVHVKEKPIVGFVYTQDQKYAYFDKEGLIVKIDSEHIEGIPCVEGIDIKNIKLYKPVKSKNTGIFGEILEASQELKKHEMTTDKIVCKKDRIYVYVGNVCISLGNHVTSGKISQIAPIMDKLEGKEGTLHLENYSEERDTVTFDVGEFPEEN